MPNQPSKDELAALRLRKLFEFMGVPTHKSGNYFSPNPNWGTFAQAVGKQHIDGVGDIWVNPNQMFDAFKEWDEMNPLVRWLGKKFIKSRLTNTIKAVAKDALPKIVDSAQSPEQRKAFAQLLLLSRDPNLDKYIDRVFSSVTSPADLDKIFSQYSTLPDFLNNRQSTIPIDNILTQHDQSWAQYTQAEAARQEAERVRKQQMELNVENAKRIQRGLAPLVYDQGSYKIDITHPLGAQRRAELLNGLSEVNKFRQDAGMPPLKLGKYDYEPIQQ